MNFQINSTGEKLVADLAYMNAKYPGNYTQLPDDAVTTPTDPTEWLIDHGPLLDRFGLAIKLQFLESTIPRVVALRTDFFGRKWLDLKNQELKGGFYYLAGITVPVLGTIPTPITGLTMAIVDSVFAMPVDQKDNQALRKAFFS